LVAVWAFFFFQKIVVSGLFVIGPFLEGQSLAIKLVVVKGYNLTQLSLTLLHILKI